MALLNNKHGQKKNDLGALNSIKCLRQVYPQDELHASSASLVIVV